MNQECRITFSLREDSGIFAADVEISTPQGIRHTTLYGNSADPFASYLKLYLDSMGSMQQFLEESSATFHLPLTPADFDIGFDRRRVTATRQILQKQPADGSSDAPASCDGLAAKSRLTRMLIPPVLLACTALAISVLPPFREEDAVLIRQVGGGALLLTFVFWLVGMTCIYIRRACVMFWRRISPSRQAPPPANGNARG
jgi:hypothetical protein